MSSIALAGLCLLAQVRKHGNSSKPDSERPFNSVNTNEAASERLAFPASREALPETNDIILAHGSENIKCTAGRALSFVATVQSNGNLLVSHAYTRMLDMKPGDAFEIKLENLQIRLVPVGGADGED